MKTTANDVVFLCFYHESGQRLINSEALILKKNIKCEAYLTRWESTVVPLC